MRYNHLKNINYKICLQYFIVILFLLVSFTSNYACSNQNEILSQENATGNFVNDQTTNSVNGNNVTKILADAKPDPPVPLAFPEDCKPLPLDNISVEIKNALNEVQKINQMIYDARAALTAGLADLT